MLVVVIIAVMVFFLVSSDSNSDSSSESSSSLADVTQSNGGESDSVPVDQDDEQPVVAPATFVLDTPCYKVELPAEWENSLTTKGDCGAVFSGGTLTPRHSTKLSGGGTNYNNLEEYVEFWTQNYPPESKKTLMLDGLKTYRYKEEIGSSILHTVAAYVHDRKYPGAGGAPFNALHISFAEDSFTELNESDVDEILASWEWK